MRRYTSLMFVFVLVIVWEIAGRLHALPAYLVAPSAIATAIWNMLRTGELGLHTRVSMVRLVIGLVIGSLSGTFIGLLAGSYRRVEQFYEPIVSLVYPIPKTAALPIIFAWFGLGDPAKIVAITISLFFPTYVAAYYGAKSVNRLHLWSARNMGASRFQIFFRVILPSALPQIFNGLRIGLALSFVLMVTTELIASQSGLGFLIGAAQDSSRFDIMYVAIVTIGVIGFAADRLLFLVRRRVLAGQLIGIDDASAND